MKVHIKEEGGRRFTLPLPAGLALRFMGFAAGRRGEAGREIKAVMRGLKQAKKVWGHLAVVEIKDKDGDEVVITL